MIVHWLLHAMARTSFFIFLSSATPMEDPFPGNFLELNWEPATSKRSSSIWGRRGLLALFNIPIPKSLHNKIVFLGGGERKHQFISLDKPDIWPWPERKTVSNLIYLKHKFANNFLNHKKQNTMEGLVIVHRTFICTVVSKNVHKISKQGGCNIIEGSGSPF